MRFTNQKYFLNRVYIKNYPNGQIGVFFQEMNGEPLAELSIMQDSIELASDEFILKDYSENSILIPDFLKSKLFVLTNRFVLIGVNLCPVFKISDRFLEFSKSIN